MLVEHSPIVIMAHCTGVLRSATRTVFEDKIPREQKTEYLDFLTNTRLITGNRTRTLQRDNVHAPADKEQHDRGGNDTRADEDRR